MNLRVKFKILVLMYSKFKQARKVLNNQKPDQKKRKTGQVGK